MKAVVFDFDGLIVDTEWPAFQAWSEIYADYQATLELKDWVQVVGTTYAHFHPVDHLQNLTGQVLDREALMRRKEERKAEISATMPILPGVVDRIAEARSLGWKIGLASTSERVWVESHLKRVGIRDLFMDLITREDVTKVKPDPEPYLAIAKRLQLSPSECLVFEDSLNGVRAAKASGARCIAVPNKVTELLDFSEADWRVKSLGDITLAECITILNQ